MELGLGSVGLKGSQGSFLVLCGHSCCLFPTHLQLCSCAQMPSAELNWLLQAVEGFHSLCESLRHSVCLGPFWCRVATMRVKYAASVGVCRISDISALFPALPNTAAT